MALRPIYRYSALLLAALALAGCTEEATELLTTETAPAPLTASMVPGLRVDTVRAEAVRSEVSLTGQVSANDDQNARVFALAGGVVQQVRVALGDHVEQGQVLAVIRSSEIAELQNQANTGQVDLTIARKNLQVAEDQFKDGLASERDLVLARQELRKAQANVGRSGKQLALYGVSADGTYTLRAPIAGTITEKNVTDHMQFNLANVESLFTISNLKTVWVIANVFQADIARVREGQTASVTTLSYPDRRFTGRIDKVFNMLSADSKSMRVRVRLENPELLLKPGMHAAVQVFGTDAGPAQPAVAARNIIFDKDRRFVVVLNDKAQLEPREVQVLKTVGDMSYVRDGLRHGERVVSKNPLLLYNELVN